MWIDNHCHLPAGSPELVASLLDEAGERGIEAFVNVGCDVAGSLAAISVAEQFAQVYATVGVHPHDAKDGTAGLRELAGRDKVVAIGECGLDYYYNHSDREAQRDAFAEQIRLAHEFDKPLVIHTREAWDETFAILDAETVPAHTVFHCFTGGPAEAERCLERGAMLSFSGIVTFPSAPELREAALLCPLDHLMVETDSPYLAPVPFRGKKNRPALVAVVGEYLAELRSMSAQDLGAATSANARRFYRLPDAASDVASDVAGDVAPNPGTVA
ncbi:MAG: TatD family hydrolase [Actinobacteria bacterium]|nr:TatD family hydrolase [Actinomycetota bacterium]